MPRETSSITKLDLIYIILRDQILQVAKEEGFDWKKFQKYMEDYL